MGFACYYESGMKFELLFEWVSGACGQQIAEAFAVDEGAPTWLFGFVSGSQYEPATAETGFASFQHIVAGWTQECDLGLNSECAFLRSS